MSRLLLIWCMMLTSLSLLAAAPRASAHASLSAKKGYVGETVNYTVTLDFDSENIDNVYVQRDMDFGVLKLVGKPTSLSRKIVRDKKSGRCSMTIALVTFIAAEAGKYTIKGGQYTVVLLDAATGYDPFWGYRQYWEQDRVEITVPDVVYTAIKLPKSNTDNAHPEVGDFTLELRTPELEVRPGGQNSIVYRMEGEGYISDSILPEFRSLFSDELRLNSVTPSASYYYSAGKLCTRIDYVCRFTAKEVGSYLVPELSVWTFNPENGKYVKLSSKPARVKVESHRPAVSPVDNGQYVMWRGPWLQHLQHATTLNYN